MLDLLHVVVVEINHWTTPIKQQKSMAYETN